MAQPPSPLVDRFGRAHTYLRLAVTERCNLRCSYCMPKGGFPKRPREAYLSDAEIHKLVAALAARGVDRVRLTGGEPLVRKNVLALARRIRDCSGIGSVRLTSNGILLGRHLPELLESGIDTVNISLDTLRRDRFEQITGGSGHAGILRTIDDLIATDAVRTKINVVLMAGVNDDEIEDFVTYVEDRPVDVRFIEFMPFAQNGWRSDRYVSEQAVVDRLSRRFSLEGATTSRSATAVMYRVAGHRGRIGFISSVSSPFCRGCNRLRISATGEFRSCLFGAPAADLRGLLREGADEDAIAGAIGDALLAKHWAHGGRPLSSEAGAPMIAIGG
jgi:GTP 3',8-cyclase